MSERSAFPLDVLEFNLDERRTFIQDHDEEMDYICACLSHYYEDVKHAIDYGLSRSVVSHFTYNLVLVLAKGLTSLTIYEYMRGAYLLEEDFDNVYKSWKSVHDSAEEIIPLLVNLEKENYFDEDIEMEDFMMDILPPYCDKAKGCEKLLNLHRRIALSTGSSLLTTLSCYIRHMEQWLADLKSGLYKAIEEDYDRVYWANYNLYKKEYWPIDGHDFRLNVQNDNFFSAEITPDFLKRCLWEEKRDFEHTPTGQLRRDFINNKKDLYFEVKRISLNEEQWRYFFKSICRFEEYQKWIEELNNPPLIDNKVIYPESAWDKIFKDAIDVSKIKPAIASLLSNEFTAPNLFVAHKVLEEIEWLQDEMDTHFISWVDDVYGWPNKARNFKSILSELKSTHTLDWNARTITSSSIALEYKKLADKIRSHFVTMNGRVVSADNTVYFKRPDLYIEHKKKL